MEYLAWWIYEDEMLRKGVTEEELAAKAAEYLQEWVYENINKAEISANAFIQFCTEGRAWVFLDTGTKRSGEKLYQFAHPTFLEYFTASYFANTCRIPDRLLEILLPRIVLREWDVMAQLAFQLQSKMPGAGDELLLALLDASYREKEENKVWNLLSFAARCLDFIIPRPKVVRTLSEVIIDRYIILGVNHLMRKETERGMRHYTRALEELCNVFSSNHEVIAETIKEKIYKTINHGSESEVRLAIDIIAYLNCSIPHLNKKNIGTWRAIADDLFLRCKTRLDILYPIYLDLVFFAKHFEQEMQITDIVKWHGLTSIFTSYRLIMFPVIFGSIADPSLATVLISTQIGPSLVRRLNILKEIGNIWLSSPLPTVDKPLSISKVDSYLEIYISESNRFPHETQVYNLGEELSLDCEVLFGAFIIVAIELEIRRYLLKFIKSGQQPLFRFIKEIFLARFQKTQAIKVKHEMDKSGFTSKQQEYIQLWIQKKIDLRRLSDYTNT